MEKVKLQFMVVPEELEKRAHVPDAVKIKVIDSEAIFLLGILGESGRELVKAGLHFYFEGKLAQKLIDMGIAEKVYEYKMTTKRKLTWEGVKSLKSYSGNLE